MKKGVKIVLGTLAGLACAGLVVAYLLAPLAVDVVELSPVTAQVTFTEQGTYDYESSFDVYPQVTGEVLEVAVQRGDAVKAGDTIAVISASDYEYQIAQLESAIKGYRAQISNLSVQEQQQKDELQGARQGLVVQLEALEAEMGRQGLQADTLESQLYFQQEAVTESRKLRNLAREDLSDAEDWYGRGSNEYMAAKQALAAAESTLAANRVQLEQLRGGGIPDDYYEGQQSSIQAQIELVDQRIGKSYTGAMSGYYSAQIESAEASISQMREQMGKATILATVDGTISELPLELANVIGQQAPVAVIGRDPLVEAYVSTRDLDGVALGDTVELVLEKRLGDETVRGTVRLIEDRAQVRLSALGVEERKVRVLIQPDSSLLIGGALEVRFSVYTQEDALVIPKTATFSLDGGDFVFVVEEQQAHLREIALGVETREGYVVEAGLSPGDWVVKDHSAQGLEVGKRVSVELP